MSSTLSLKKEDKPQETPQVKPNGEHKISPLPGGRFGPAESMRNCHLANVPAGTPFEDVLSPEFWKNYSPQLRPFDHIEIRAEDGKYWADVLVTDVGHGFAIVETINHKELSTIKEDRVSILGFTAEWGGTVDKYRVIRDSDKVVMSKSHPSIDKAVSWIATNK